jgi:hypothetical protein
LGLDEGFAGKRFICAQESAEFRVARGFACSVMISLRMRVGRRGSGGIDGVVGDPHRGAVAALIRGQRPTHRHGSFASHASPDGRRCRHYAGCAMAYSASLRAGIWLASSHKSLRGGISPNTVSV